MAELAKQDDLIVQKDADMKCEAASDVTRVKDNHVGQPACFIKGSQARKFVGRGKCSDEGPEEEQEGMVCQMAGEQREQVPFPIIIDSVACTSVMPTSWCPHVPTEETDESRAGGSFRAANAQTIHNEGNKVVSFMTKGGAMRDMKFTSCEAPKAKKGRILNIWKQGR